MTLAPTTLCQCTLPSHQRRRGLATTSAPACPTSPVLRWTGAVPHHRCHTIMMDRPLRSSWCFARTPYWSTPRSTARPGECGESASHWRETVWTAFGFRNPIQKLVSFKCKSLSWVNLTQIKVSLNKPFRYSSLYLIPGLDIQASLN